MVNNKMVDQIEVMTMQTSIGPAKVEIHRPTTTIMGMSINIHGGDFTLDHSSVDSDFSRELALATQNIVFDLYYPLSPKPFPQALQVCSDIVQVLENDYLDEYGIPTLIGHGAGANLAIGTQIVAQRIKLPKVGRVILDDPLLRIDDQTYLGAQSKVNPLISPFYADKNDLTGFPQTSVIIPDDLTYRTDDFKFSQMLIDAGSYVQIKQYQASKHGFLIDGTGMSKQARLDLISQVNSNVI